MRLLVRDNTPNFKKIDARRAARTTARGSLSLALSRLRVPPRSTMPQRTVLTHALGLSAADETLLSRWVHAGHPTSLGSEETRALQDAFVHLHRFMFRKKLLPLSLFGLERSSSRTPVATSAPGGGTKRDWNWSRMDDEIISRRGFIQFIGQNAHLVAQAGPPVVKHSGRAVCLGWDDLTYARLPSLHCDPVRSMAFRYAPSASVRHDTISANLDEHTIDDLSKRVHGHFDLILCNQVFEHVSNPSNAAQLLYRLLKPRGMVFWTAPFVEMYHQAPEDHYRYTCVGATQLFKRSGFSPVRVQKIGDTETASGYMLGFGPRDFQGTGKMDADQLVNSRVDSKQISMDLWDGAYISCALVVQRP